MKIWLHMVTQKDYTVIGQDCGIILAGAGWHHIKQSDYPDDEGNGELVRFQQLMRTIIILQ